MGLAFRFLHIHFFTSTGKVCGPGDYRGKRYKDYLRAADAELRSSNYNVAAHYVYIFAVDQFDDGTLVYSFRRRLPKVSQIR